MTGILDLIKNNIGQSVVDQVSRQVGGSKDTTQQVISAAIPMLISALQKKYQCLPRLFPVSNNFYK